MPPFFLPARGVLFAGAALTAFTSPAARPAESQVPGLLERVNAALAARDSALIAIRHDLHRHPEVSLQEERTARVVAEQLRALGLEVRTGVGGHGVIGTLRGGRPGPVVAFRADMDAVSSDAPDPVEFRSMSPGVRHICGHDVHTTVGLALAAGLAAVRAELPGTVLFLFQPAEERVVGAKAMLDAGAFAPARPEAIFGVHTAPFPVGQLATTPGVMMAWRDLATVTLTGPGDLARAADSVARELGAVGNVSRQQALGALPPGFIFVQVLPPAVERGAATVRASISVAADSSTAQARAEIARRVEALRLPGVTPRWSYEARAVPGVTNDSALTAAATAAVRAVLGPGSVLPVPAIPPGFSEDFGAFQRLVPGVFFYLGVGPAGMPHSPGYVADDAAIQVGARAMAAAILDRLGSAPPPVPADTMIDVGGQRLHFRVWPGRGEVAIVFQAGGGADLGRWATVPARTAAATGARVIAYDRAGLGSSEVGPIGLTPEAELDQLDRALDALGVRRAVLAGHSYGGLLSLVHLARRPDRVAGLVLVDPMNPDFIAAMGLPWLKATVPPVTDPRTGRDTVVYRMQRTIDALFERARDAAAAIRVPAIVITAGVPWYGSAEADAAWRRSHEQLAGRAARGELVVATRSRHDVPGTEPEVVVDAVRRLLAQGPPPS